MKTFRQFVVLLCLPMAATQALAQSCPPSTEEVLALTAARKVVDRQEQDSMHGAIVAYQGANYKLLGVAPTEVRVGMRDRKIHEAIIGLPGKNVPAYFAALKRNLPSGGKLECSEDQCKWELGREARIGELKEILVYDTIYFDKDTTLWCTYAAPSKRSIVDMLYQMEQQKKR
ncbi:hypothetical protein [Massilia sp. DD77]|uniref:hypothetical protein n=1 Tax=Massilia sp. DD77 TaxID=3109349 RepID=UPI003000CB97